MTFKVRIRGIYATALTKLLLDSGFRIVQPSQVIVDRFNIENPDYSPPDLTIKDSENVRGALTLIGKCEAVEEVLKIFYKISSEIIVWKCKIPLHRVVRGVVKKVESSRVVVDLGDGVEGIIPTLSAPLYREGDVIPVTVVKTALRDDEEIILSTDLRLDTEYVSIVPGGRVYVSRHIRDHERKAELLSLGMMFLDKLSGYGIKWRSSAQYADRVKLIEELEKAIEKFNEIRNIAYTSEPYTVIQEGECIVEILPSLEFRRFMDDVRNSVIPTLKYHHSLKMFLKKTSIIDYTEHILSYVQDRRDDITRAFIDYVYSRKYSIVIRHCKPNGEIIKIGPATVLEYNDGEFILFRRLKPGGVLDGLGVEKESGDYAITHARIGNYYLVHAYFNKDKKLKGVYVNINTPIEPVRGGIYYIDLYIDIVKRPNEDVRIIDFEEFERLKNMNAICEDFYNKILKIVDDIHEKFDDYVCKCVDYGENIDKYISL